MAGSCEHGDEPSGFIKCGEFVDWMKNCLLPRIFFLSPNCMKYDINLLKPSGFFTFHRV